MNFVFQSVSSFLSIKMLKLIVLVVFFTSLAAENDDHIQPLLNSDDLYNYMKDYQKALTKFAQNPTKPKELLENFKTDSTNFVNDVKGMFLDTLNPFKRINQLVVRYLENESNKILELEDILGIKYLNIFFRKKERRKVDYNF